MASKSFSKNQECLQKGQGTHRRLGAECRGVRCKHEPCAVADEGAQQAPRPTRELCTVTKPECLDWRHMVLDSPDRFGPCDGQGGTWSRRIARTDSGNNHNRPNRVFTTKTPTIATLRFTKVAAVVHQPESVAMAPHTERERERESTTPAPRRNLPLHSGERWILVKHPLSLHRKPQRSLEMNSKGSGRRQLLDRTNITATHASAFNSRTLETTINTTLFGVKLKDSFFEH